MAIPVGVFVLDTAASMDVAVLAKRAEELGFASFWVPEHPVIPVTTSTPYPGDRSGVIPSGYYWMADPWNTLARASGTTSSILLGTAICILPEHNPLLMSKQVATLDNLSGGRVIVGLGVGWLKEELELLGGNYERKGPQSVDNVRALKEIWTKDESEYHGEFYDFPAVKVFPKPTQKPHPPIVFGGGLTPANSEIIFRRIVRVGDGWLPVLTNPGPIKDGRRRLDEKAKEAGRDPSSIKIYAMGREGAFRTMDDIKALEDAGADHVVLWMDNTQGEAALAELEERARIAL